MVKSVFGTDLVLFILNKPPMRIMQIISCLNDVPQPRVLRNATTNDTHSQSKFPSTDL